MAKTIYYCKKALIKILISNKAFFPRRVIMDIGLNTLSIMMILITFLPSITIAETTETVKQLIPKRIFNIPEKTIITLVVENDSLGSGTDSNYTSGVRIHFTNVNAKFPKIAHKIDKLIPTFEINETSSIYYSLGQSLFSPKDKSEKSLIVNDRPWAAFLYGSIGMATLTNNHVDEVELTLGIVGPAALGKISQKFIHKHITNSVNPQGWDNQIKNEPAFMLAWQRSWPTLAKGIIADNFWSLQPYFGATIGNVLTYGNIGINMQYKPYDTRWQDTPIRVRPSMPSTGIYEIPPNRWSWNLFTAIEARAIAQNIFLDGNTFTNSHSVDKKLLIGEATAGFAITYNKIRTGYTIVYRTKEFNLQEKPEIFGALSLAIRF